jgi:thiosulfate/3-mercaptopyruvate sulfurtransferase
MKAARWLVFLMVTSMALVAAARGKLPGPLVDSEWLDENQDDVLILDVRKDVKSFVGVPVYEKDKKTGKQKLKKVGGHIPGAVLVNYKKIRATRVIGDQKIEKLVPEKADFEALIQSLGVNSDSPVVIVSRGEDSLDMTMATRLYWQMKYFGHNDLAILDGGLAQWVQDGHEVVSTPPEKKKNKGNWIAKSERDEILATTQEVEDALKAGDVQLVDNRPISQYLGMYKKAYVAAKGHIPGAKSFPNELMTGPKNKARFQAHEELMSLAAAMGVDPDQPSITYCNSGHLASGGWFILHELMGNKAVQLYDGSLHEYTKTNNDLATMKLE